MIIDILRVYFSKKKKNDLKYKNKQREIKNKKKRISILQYHILNVISKDGRRENEVIFKKRDNKNL